jgi:hypothetical protein
MRYKVYRYSLEVNIKIDLGVIGHDLSHSLIFST